jgi:competence protein ComEC
MSSIEQSRKPPRLLPLFIGVLLCFTMDTPTGGQSRSHGSDQDLRIGFIDVGQGDAIWIQTPAEGQSRSQNILIDGGPDRGRQNRLITYLRTYGLRPGAMIDAIIVTHPHDDHYPGLLDVLAQYQVRTIVDSGFPKGGKHDDFLRSARAETVDGEKSEVIALRGKADFRLDWGRNAEARILHTDSASLKVMGSGNTRENNASTVVRVTMGKFSFLLMGDAEGKQRKNPATTTKFVERLLLDRLQPSELRSTVLKAGHHGSETGSTSAFLQVVQPQIVVVMSGRRSFHGVFLPDEHVLDRYRQQNPRVRVFRTDDQDEAEGHTTENDADGDDIHMQTDGKTLRVYQAIGEDGRRRWRRAAILN